MRRREALCLLPTAMTLNRSALGQAAPAPIPNARASSDLRAYKPVQIHPSKTAQGWEFELDAALAQAARDGRHLYLILSAWDCHFCARYERFLQTNADPLVPEFERHRLRMVYLHSALEAQGDRVFLRAHGRSTVYADFQRRLGDERTQRMVYPVVWLLTAQLQSLIQMPYGTGTFETVPEQLEVIAPALQAVIRPDRR